jgi:hypothetical protein
MGAEAAEASMGRMLIARHKGQSFRQTTLRLRLAFLLRNCVNVLTILFVD